MERCCFSEGGIFSFHGCVLLPCIRPWKVYFLLINYKSKYFNLKRNLPNMCYYAFLLWTVICVGGKELTANSNDLLSLFCLKFDLRCVTLADVFERNSSLQKIKIYHVVKHRSVYFKTRHPKSRVQHGPTLLTTMGHILSLSSPWEIFIGGGGKPSNWSPSSSWEAFH